MPQAHRTEKLECHLLEELEFRVSIHFHHHYYISQFCLTIPKYLQELTYKEKIFLSHSFEISGPNLGGPISLGLWWGCWMAMAGSMCQWKSLTSWAGGRIKRGKDWGSTTHFGICPQWPRKLPKGSTWRSTVPLSRTMPVTKALTHLWGHNHIQITATQSIKLHLHLRESSQRGTKQYNGWDISNSRLGGYSFIGKMDMSLWALEGELSWDE